MALAGDYEPSALDWVREHVEQVLRTGTTDGVTINGLPTVLMTYRGAKTGKVRKTPVMRVEHDGRYAAVASKGGEPANPQWYASLVAEPLVELQDGAATGAYWAREVSGDEKALWWHRAVDAYPDYAALPARDRPPDPGLRARTHQHSHTRPGRQQKRVSTVIVAVSDTMPYRPGPDSFTSGIR